MNEKALTEYTAVVKFKSVLDSASLCEEISNFFEAVQGGGMIKELCEVVVTEGKVKREIGSNNIITVLAGNGAIQWN